jgi:hypothetical protein
VELLVRTDEAEREHGRAVVAALDRPGEDRMRDHAKLGFGDPELGQRVAAAPAVHDDALEAVEEAPPERDLRRRSPWQQVVCGEDERSSVPQQSCVELGRRDPLHVQDVGRDSREPREAERMLEHLQRQPQARAAEEPRRERVEELAPAVAVRLRHVAKAEAGGDELDLGPCPGQCGRERVVVRRREGGRIGDDDAHRSS